MAAEHQLDATTYIQHHLTFFAEPVRESGGFWTIHYDTVITSVILGVVVLGFLWLVTRKATSGVPSKTQAFVELSVQFVNDQVKSMFHHDYKFVAPVALTVFVVGAVHERDGLPARRHHGVDLHERLSSARVAPGPDGRRQYDVRAGAVRVRADDLLQHQDQGPRRLDSRALLLARSAPTRCCGRSISCSI